MLTSVQYLLSIIECFYPTISLLVLPGNKEVETIVGPFTANTESTLGGLNMYTVMY